MDTGATSHLNFNAHSLSTIFNTRLYPSIHVGDGNSISVTNTGHNIIPSIHRPLHLNNVLVTPNVIKNLISVRQFTRDNNCTIEFDAFGFSVKDFLTRHILLRCDSSVDLYPVTKPSTLPAAFVSTSSSTWHQRLGHPEDEVLRSLSSRHLISCNKTKSSHVFHACQLGKHVKLSFHSSNSSVKQCFDIIHSDLWTSPIISSSGFKISKPIDRLSLNTSSISPIPKSPFRALKDPYWSNAMDDEYNALVKNGTWVLVPRPADVNMVRSMWLFKHKFHADASSTALLQQIIASLHKEFDMTDLGALNYFLSIFATHHSTGLFLSQKKYALQLLERAHMVSCNPSRTPVDTEAKLGPDGVPVQDPTLYHSLAGGLQYITFTRPDLSYTVQQICLHMHDPREPHLADLKRILRYVRGTLDFGLHLYASATTSLVGYTDADWTGCPSTRMSTSGYYVFLCDNLLSWSSKRKHTISRSSSEAKYSGVANVVAETAWIRNLLRELHSPLVTATLVYYDNVSAVYMSANPVQHQQTKHIEIDIHFVREMVIAVMFEFFMFRLIFSLQLSSPRVFLQPYHNLWDVIVNRDLEEEPAPTGETSASPAPKTAKQLAAKRNQERVKSILLLAMPDEYLLKFHNGKQSNQGLEV
ncbi:ribonuclease H-like domain-containing protein [Tanacetum coccineum]